MFVNTEGHSFFNIYTNDFGRLKMQDRKMTDRKMTDNSAGLENAGLENDGQKCTVRI